MYIDCDARRVENTPLTEKRDYVFLTAEAVEFLDAWGRYLGLRQGY